MKKCSLKRVFSLLLSFIMVAGIVFAAVPNQAEAAGGDVVFTTTADKEILHRGDKVTVTVSMASSVEVYGIQYQFEYDTNKLKLDTTVKGDAFSNMGTLEDGDISMLNPYSGGVSAVVGKTTGPVNTGSVMTMTFSVLDDAATGKLVFTQGTVLASDTASKSLNCDCVDNTNIRISIPATGISLDKSTVDIVKGQTEQLVATMTPDGADSAVTWTSSDEAVASVAADGTVTAKAAGKATITATAEGKRASCTVNVTIPLNGISIQSQGTGTIKKGQYEQLSVVYDPADTTENKTVTWSSSVSSVATVDSNGLVTAISDGTAEITAKVGSKTASYTITVKEVKLTAISIKAAATIHKGESETLEVTYDPADTTDDKTVQWSSSDESKVRVDGSGRVTAVAVGGATITARVGNFTATCQVTVDAPLKRIVPAKSSIDIVKNQTAVITYTLDPADTTDDRTVTFASSTPEVAEVDAATGEVTAKKAGTATITLSGANGVAAQVLVVVAEIPINSVVLDKVNAVVEKEQTIELTATVGPENTTDDDRTITWTSSDSTVATVSPATSDSGETVTVTTTAKGGNVSITAAAANGTKAVCEIIVPIHMTGISLPATAEMNRKSTETLTVIYEPENTTDDKTVTWTSDDPSIATVDPDTGMITALKEGTVNITATTTKTTAPYSASAKVTVKENHLESDIGDTIEFDELSDPVLKGQSYNMYRQMNLAKIIEDNNITDDITIEWTSSDEAVATIDQTGNVTGLKKGKTMITAVIIAKDGNGNPTGEYTVETEIEIKEIPLESIAFNKIIKEMQVGATDVLEIIYNPDDTTELKDVAWSSSDPSVLSVEDGKLTALKAGVAEITAKVGDKSVTCEITVKDANASGANDGKNTGDGNGTGARAGNGREVRTGDAANIALYLILLLLSVAAITVCYVIRSRKVRR